MELFDLIGMTTAAGGGPSMPAEQTVPRAKFKRPGGFQNTLGTIADALAALGGSPTSYRDEMGRREQDFNQQQKNNIFGQLMAGGNNPELLGQLAEIDPEAAMAFQKQAQAMQPKPPNPVSPSGEIQLLDRLIAEGIDRGEAVQLILDNRRKNAQIIGDAQGQYALDPRNRQPVPLGVGPKPFAPPTPQVSYLPGGDGQYYAADARSPEMTPTGVQAPPKGAAEGAPTSNAKTAATDAAKRAAIAPIQRMARAYAKMADEGEAPGSARTGFGNVANRLAVTGIGQFVGEARGTDNQAIIEEIEAARSGLAPLYAGASGLNSRQFDTPAEQERFLRSTGNVGARADANLKSLAALAVQMGDPDAVAAVLTPEQRKKYLGVAAAPAAPRQRATVPAQGSRGVSVTAPNGKTYTFPSQKAADDYLRAVQ